MKNKFVTILENLGLIAATLGPAFVKSDHGQAILAASTQLLIAEIQANAAPTPSDATA